MNTEVLQLEMGKITLGENDYLVLKMDAFQKENALEIMNVIKTHFPALAPKTIILSDGVEIYVVHKEDK